jgi:hypothetical protein
MSIIIKVAWNIRNYRYVWDVSRGMIAKPSRLILVKFVMAGRVVHQFIIVEAPTWLLEEINKSLCGFFWAGKERANGG